MTIRKAADVKMVSTLNPLITIVTPVYNRERLVVDAIESVVCQTYTNWEHIIVDDQSTDNTWNSINRFAGNDKRIISLRRNREPKGAQTCRNMGIKSVRGKYIIFLDSDDVLLPFCLEQRADFISKMETFDCAIFPRKKIKKMSKDDILLSFIRYRLPLQTTDLLWHVDFISNIGGFNEKLPRFQDVELVIRAFLEKGMRYICSEDHLPDSIYNPYGGNTAGPKSELIFNGLMLFINEAVFLLQQKRMVQYKKHLKNYLCSWLIHYHRSETMDKSIDLIRIFHSQGIISGLLSRMCLVAVNFSKYGVLKSKMSSKILFYSLFKMS